MATERVGIEIEILGYKEALSQMQNLERAMKGLQGIKMRMDVGKRLKALKQNMASLRAEAERLKASMADSTRGSAEWTKDAARLRQVRREMSQTAAEAQRLNQIMRSTSSVGQMFKRNTTAVAHLGSAMQSAGNAMQRFLAPWRLLTGGALLGAGYSAINKMTEGLTSGFERYDIMKKYPRVMKQLGFSAKDSEKSVHKLDEAVQGLPTGLDEIISVAQRFTQTLGDMDKGTDLAIAANNAFLASMSTETQRYQGMMQLQDLLNGKKLRNTEWNSLISSMGTAINEMGKILGYDDPGKFRKALQANEVAAEDFLDALVKVGTGEGKIAKIATESMDTWEAFSSRIGTAFSRMTYGVLTSMDEIVKSLGLKDKNGKDIESLNMFLDSKVIPGIDNMAKSVKKWIDANPEKIKEFFSDLASIDWAGFGKGFIKGLGDIANLVQRFAKWADGKSFEGLGNFFSKLIWLAPGLTIFGGLLKGFRHGIGGGLTGLALLIDAVAGLKVGKAEKNASKLGKLASKLGKIGKLFGGAGLAGEAVVGAAGGAGAKLGAGAILKGFAPAAAIIGGIGGLVTEIVGIAAIDTWIIKKGVDNIVSITDGIQKVYDNLGTLKENKASIDKDMIQSLADDMYSIYGILFGQASGETSRKAQTKATGAWQKTNGFGQMRPGKLKSAAESMNQMVLMFQNIGKVLGQIPKLNELIGQNMAQQGGESPFSQLKNALTGKDGLFTMFGQIMDEFDGSLGKNVNAGDFAAKMEQLSTAVSSIKSAVSKLSALGTGDLAGTDTGAFTAIANIKTMISKIGEALNTDALNGIGEQVKAFSEKITNMFDTLNRDFEKVEVEVHIDGKVTGYKELVQQIKSADSAIRSAVRSITNSYTKHVYVHIQRHVNVTGDAVPSDGEVIGRHTGGLATHLGKPIYRSGGGSVFKPKGKDIIPAMLSEGEYVQSKKAVDFFGVRFMQKLNHLDVKGAMRELSARVGANSVMARGMTVYNNITNNNQTVNQNVRTNNPNFAFRRSRYIAAL